MRAEPLLSLLALSFVTWKTTKYMNCKKRSCLQGEGTSDSNTSARSSTYEKSSLFALHYHI